MLAGNAGTQLASALEDGVADNGAVDAAEGDAADEDALGAGAGLPLLQPARRRAATNVVRIIIMPGG